MLRKVSLAYVSLAFLLLLLFSQAVQSSEASQESDDELLRRMSDLCPDCDPDWLVTASDEDIDSLARMLTNSSDTLKSSDGEEVGEEDSSNLWYIGILIQVVAATISNFGVNSQRLSLVRESRKEKSIQRVYVMQPLWVFGLLLLIAGAIGDLVSLSFAAAALIIPVGGGARVLSNSLIARYWLKEPLNSYDFSGMGVVVVAITMVSVSASKDDRNYTLDELIDLFETTDMLIYLIAVATVIFTLAIMARWLAKLSQNRSRRRLYMKWYPFHQVVFPIMSGVFGAQSVLLGKAIAEIAASVIDGGNAMGRWQTYLFLIGVGCTVGLQLHTMAHGLRRASSVITVPTFQCTHVTWSIIAGAVYYHELAGFESWQYIVFISGVLLLFVGIAILSLGQKKHLEDSTRRERTENLTLRSVALAIYFTIILKNLKTLARTVKIPVETEDLDMTSRPKRRSERLQLQKEDLKHGRLPPLSHPVMHPRVGFEPLVTPEPNPDHLDSDAAGSSKTEASASTGATGNQTVNPGYVPPMPSDAATIALTAGERIPEEPDEEDYREERRDSETGVNYV